MRDRVPSAALCFALTVLIGASGSPHAHHGDDLGYVLHAARSTLYKTPLRVYYRGNCNASEDDPLNFPPLKKYDFETPRSERRGVPAMRTMLGTDVPDAIVSHGPRGILQVHVRAVTTRILGARISVLRLTPLEQYNPNLAILAIKRTKEVTAAVQRSGLRFPLEIMDMIVQQPAAGLPHLASVLNDTTADEALDSVALTFRGIVIYDECRKARGGGGYLGISFIGLE